VEHQVGREHAAQPTGAHHVTDPLHGRREPVRKVDVEQPIGGPGRLDHAAGLLGVATEGLLAEDGQAALERGDRLVGVESAGRGDHDSVEVHREQLVQALRHLRRRRQLLRALGRRADGIGEGDDVGHLARRERPEPPRPDPAQAEQAQPRPQRRRPARHRAHATTNPLMKPSGRRSAALRARPRSSRANACVYSGDGSSSRDATAATAASTPSR
jgi:hypothetical protein